MNFVNVVISRYRRLVALATGNLGRYKKAFEEIRTALLLTPVAFVVPLLLAFLGGLQDTLMLVFLGTGLGISIWIKVIDTLTSISSYRKKLDEELPFFVLEATAVSKTGLEPVELLKFITNSKVLYAFSELGKRFLGLFEIYGVFESLSFLSRLAGDRTRLFLSEYLASLSSGTALQYLRDRAMDFVKGIAVNVERALNSKITISILIAILFSIAPVILISMSTMFMVNIEQGTVSENSTIINIVSALIVLVSALTCFILPDYPYVSKVIIDKKMFMAYRALFTFGTIVLAFPPLMLVLDLADLNTFKTYAFYSSIAAIAIGVYPFIKTLTSLTIRIDDVVESMANHIRVYRTMYLFKSNKLENLAKKSTRLWLIDYLNESIEFFKTFGDTDPYIFDIFTMFVFEIQRMLRKTMFYILLVIAAIVLAPYLSTATISLGAGLGMTKSIISMAYIATTSFGFVASKIAMGKNISTLLPGFAALLFTLTL
ncbi:hypothetical protein QPL79_07935 [Ignisphaera sp. 4213-co]|uniref:Type II secretion system protein GspF domain-containing protein n=1 Tax=Ignisphaera cupida TaxID=3050454 RepID=A0ABD4Z830_9CREN|nr:hypothetical protein [Ignisphaera sp. 4213-co]MDK6029289.1 hypothetical protein [Ignisphaera sp. 4213-co]